MEGYHRQIRKITKTKGVFPSDAALKKLVYLAYRNIKKKWTMSLANWGQSAQQLAIKFGDRFQIMYFCSCDFFLICETRLKIAFPI
jgi:putative transposase